MGKKEDHMLQVPPRGRKQMFVASSRPSTSRLSADSCNAKVAGTDFHPDLAKISAKSFQQGPQIQKYIRD